MRLTALLASASAVAALPARQFPFAVPIDGDAGFDVLAHLSGISPYFSAIPESSAQPPAGCQVNAASVMMRHGSIHCNDDELEQEMQPFLNKLEAWQSTSAANRTDSSLAWLRTWTSPIEADEVEALTPGGADDARQLGRQLGELYSHLVPRASDDFSRFDVWASDSDRDIGTAKAFIAGALPQHSGGDGSGDDHVNLIVVPKKTPNWKKSLTPHKACKRFDKERGKAERRTWEDVYTAPIIERLAPLLPGLELNASNVVGMQMLCGYETLIRGRSELCATFTPSEWRSFEYAQDLWYWYSMGYGALEETFAPSVGFPFLRTAATKLLATHGEDVQASGPPKPGPSPNDTSLPQRLWVWTSHREEPSLIAAALGLYNNSAALASPPANINATMPLDRINPDRLWRTTRILPFLGHITLERLRCDDATSHVRVVINGAPQRLPGCDHGPGGSCPLHDGWDGWFADREERYGDFEAACAV